MCAPRNFVAALFREHLLLSLSLSAPLRSALLWAAPRDPQRGRIMRSRAHKGNGVREGLGGEVVYDEDYFSTTYATTPRKVNRAK